MKTLFERVFNGSDEMFAKAEEEVNKIVAEVGRDAALTMPSTAYFLACILGGAEVDGGILWCVTELVSRQKLDEVVAIVKEVTGK